MKPFFSPKQFLTGKQDAPPGQTWYLTPEECAHVANSLLDAHLKTLPRVDCIDSYGDDSPATWHQQHSEVADKPHKHVFTHTALLWGVEKTYKLPGPIDMEVKDKCNKCGYEHHPMDLVCDRCGAER